MLVQDNARLAHVSYTYRYTTRILKDLDRDES